MDWKTCLDEGNSAKITPDRKRAIFLMKHAEKTLKILEEIKLDNDNCSVFFTNYYDALLELLHAIMYHNGYKVKNHYCLGYYLRDNMKDFESFRVFDRARIVRNSVIYYGERFDKEIFDEVIGQIKLTFAKLKKSII